MKKLLSILVLGLLLSGNAYAEINWQKRNLCEKSKYKDLCSIILNKKLAGINTIANFKFDKGKIIAMEINDLSGIGPYSMYPRTSAIETNQVLNLSGAPYIIPNYRAVGTVVFQNKTPMCQYRAVGHPIAVAITEALVDKGAQAINIRSDEIRKINFIPDNKYPNKTPSGVPLEDLSHQAAMNKLLKLINILN